MAKVGQDMVNVNYFRNMIGNVLVDSESVKGNLKDYLEKLLNKENICGQMAVSEAKGGLECIVIQDDVSRTLSKMRHGMLAGQFGAVSEMLTV